MASNLPSTAVRTISGPGSPRATRHSTCRPKARARSAPRSTISLASSTGSSPIVARIFLGDVEQRDRNRRVEEADDGVEEVGAQGTAVVGQEQPLDAVPALAQLGQEMSGLGGSGAGLGDLAAAGDVEPHVAVFAQAPGSTAARAWRRTPSSSRAPPGQAGLPGGTCSTGP